MYSLLDAHIEHLINIGFKDQIIIDINNHLQANKLKVVTLESFGLVANSANRQCVYGRYFKDIPLNDMYLVAYTDGSGVTTDKSVGSAAIIRGNSSKLDISHSYGPGTNNIAELTGIYLSLCAVYWSDIDLTVYSDSEYSIGILSKPWTPKQNKELVSEIRSMLKYRKANFKHVKGHNGNELNELADKLAGQARIKE